MTAGSLLKPTLRSVGAYEPGESLDELMARHGLTVAKLNWNEGLWGPLPGVRAADRRARPGVGLSRARLQRAARGDRGAHARPRRAGAARPRHPGADHDARQRVRQPRRHRRRPRPDLRPVRAGLPRRGRAGRARRLARAAARPRGDRRRRAAHRREARVDLRPEQPDGPAARTPTSGRRSWTPSARTASWSPTRPTWTTSRPAERMRREDDVAAGRRVVVLRTFSKIFGLAGLRLGYAVADPALAALPRQRAGAVQRQPRGARRRRVASLAPPEREARRARARPRCASASPRARGGRHAAAAVVGELRPRRAAAPTTSSSRSRSSAAAC